MNSLKGLLILVGVALPVSSNELTVLRRFIVDVCFSSDLD